MKISAAVTFLLTCALACAHPAPKPNASSTVAVRLHLGSAVAPLGTVTIHSNGHLENVGSGGTHMSPRRVASGTLAPGELNDILITLTELGFWDWPTGSMEGARGMIEVRLGTKTRRVYEDGVIISDPALAGSYRAATERILQFAEKTAPN